MTLNKYYWCLFVMLSASCCEHYDTQCREKKLLVIKELYKLYNELKGYQQTLIQRSDKSIKELLDISRKTNHPKQFRSKKIHILSNSNMNEGSLRGSFVKNSSDETKTINDLGNVLSMIRDLLILMLSSPDKVGSNEVNLLFNALKLTVGETRSVHNSKKDQRQGTSNLHTTAAVYTAPFSLNNQFMFPTTDSSMLFASHAMTSVVPMSFFSQSKPFLPTPIPRKHVLISTTTLAPTTSSTTTQFTTTVMSSTKTQSTTTTTVTSSTDKTQISKTKKSKKKPVNKHEVEEARKEHRDSMRELRELWAEYNTMRQFMFGFGRR